MVKGIIKTAVIYARYSSDNQREESIDAQIRACKYYAQKENIKIVGVYSEACDIIEPTQRNQQYQRFQRVGHFFITNIIRPGLILCR